MAFIGGGGGFFGGQQAPSRLQVVQFDTSILSGVYNAQLLQRSISQAPRTQGAVDLGGLDPSITAPWQQQPDDNPRSLNAQVNEIRRLANFVDLRDERVRAAGDDPDAQTSFALYVAVERLRTLAEFASQDDTNSASLTSLNQLFQKGFEEIKAFLGAAETNRLDFVLGEKTTRVESEAAQGDDASTFQGQVIQTGSRDDAIAGLNGTEVFTLRLEKFGETTDITIDLSQIGGTISINSLIDFVNGEIEKVTVDNGSGEQVPQFQTRLQSFSDDNNDYGLELDSSILESVRLIPQTAEPALFVTSNRSDLFGDEIATARLSEFSGLSGTLTLENSYDIAGLDEEAGELAKLLANVEKAERENSVIGDILKQIDEENAELSGEPATPVATTRTGDVAIDSEGFVYVVGATAGDLDNKVNAAEGEDVFLSKFDRLGNLVYSRLLGAAESADGFALTIDSADNVIVTGKADGKLAAGDQVRGTDAFVAKFEKNGDEVFRYQLDTAAASEGLAVTTNANGDIFVTGESRGAIGGATSALGGADGFALKLSSTGQLLNRATFGTSGDDAARAAAVDADGNLIVAARENGDLVIRRLSGANLSTVLDQVNLGSLGSGSVENIEIDNGDIYVVGTSEQSVLAGSVSNAASGGRDGFVTKLDSSLNAQFTSFIGSTGTDTVNDVAVSGGKIYVAGSAGGSIGGETRGGVIDTYVARLDATSGALEDVEQVGETLQRTEASGIAFTNTGSSVLDTLGLPLGTLPIRQTRDVETQTTLRAGDSFYIRVNDGVQRQIRISAGDDFRDLVRKINLVSLRGIEAEITGSDDRLRIKAEDGYKIEISSGPEGRDALERLGIKPTTIAGSDLLFDLENEEEDSRSSRNREPETLGGIFGLSLDLPLNLSDKTNAKFALRRLQDAGNQIQRAFRSLRPDPFRDAFSQNQPSGPVPTRIQKQINNFTDALVRLQSANQGGGVSFFA